MTVVAAGLGVYGAKTVLASGCDDVTDYRLAADPSIAPAVRAVLDRTAEEDLGCASIDVTDAPSAVQAGALAKPDGVPSLWLPESSLWVTKAGRTTGTLLDVASPSVAASPAVVATRSQDAPFLDSWLSVLRVPGQRIGDPMSDGAAIAPIAAVLAEVEQGQGQAGALLEAMVPIAQAHAAT
ncbi:MAG: hypothetical protein ICV72_02945, partial [Aldersonia sp.]|nr:hypothetical protein [Aldersonia sp.]